MIVTFRTADFLDTLKNIVGVAENKQNMPILANVYFKVGSGSLVMAASDLEVEVFSSEPFSSTEEAETTLNARKLFDIVKSLEEKEEITLRLEENKTTISAGKSKFVLTAMNPAEFPLMEREERGSDLQIESHNLLSLFNETSFSMAHQDARHYLNGLFLNSKGKEITAVATDGHRLAISEGSGTTGENNINAIVPRKCILEIKRILAGVKGNKEHLTEVMCNNKQISFKIGKLVVTSRLIEGSYPEYKKVIPEALPNHLTLDRKTFKGSLHKMAILSNEQYRGVKLVLAKNELKLAANNPAQEEGEDLIPCEYKGEEIEVGFNVSYLLEVLEVLDEDKIMMKLNNSDTGCLITCEKNTPQYIIMPMRV